MAVCANDGRIQYIAEIQTISLAISSAVIFASSLAPIAATLGRGSEKQAADP